MKLLLRLGSCAAALAAASVTGLAVVEAPSTQPSRAAVSELAERRFFIQDLLGDACNPAAIEEIRTALTNHIEQAVAPQTWNAGASITADGGSIIVRQTPQNLRDVTNLIAQLQDGKSKENSDRAEAVAAEIRARTKPVALDMKLGRLTFHGTPFSDVIDAIRKASCQNIFVNWDALKTARVLRSLPVTADLSNLSLRDAVDRLLNDVGGKTVALGYVVDQDVLSISTDADLSRNVTTRVCDVRSAIRSEITRDADVAAVVNRVRGIDPLTWQAAGGEIGSIKVLSGQLIVTQTKSIQDRIAVELRDILPAR